MKVVFNKLMGMYLAAKSRSLRSAITHPHERQRKWFRYLMSRARGTEFGKEHGLRHARTPADFAKQVPVQDYESLRDGIHRMMMGQENVLWPGRVKWYAKSSGTTSDRSKFIPVTRENFQRCHAKGTWDTLTSLYDMLPDASVFYRKNLIMGGSLSKYDANPETRYGDVSAIMIHNLPWYAKPFLSPDMETALLYDWEEKITRMAAQCSKEDIGMFGGVPTWTIVLFRRILELTGKNNMLEIWPNAQVYMHGGVGFRPYERTFREFFPSDDFIYQEVYNASEGFFATQDVRGSDDMLLLIDNGMYFEFIPEGEWSSEHPRAIPLHEVETGVDYALVISTNSGLWRYTPGDTITFTNTDPYRIRVTGRTQQYINAFGEEVMIDNVEKAIAMASDRHSARVAEFTVGPLYLDGSQRGAHEWFIEFANAPADLQVFRRTLDSALQEVNSDYAAKRSADLALELLHLKVVPTGTFTKWMAHRGKLGGQNKIPRVSNDRRYIDDLVRFLGRTVKAD